MRPAERLTNDTRTLVIGLVGGLGSGKSHVAASLARRGARVIAADPMGHEALRHPDVREQVFARWGRGVADGRGEVDRRKLGAVVFADPAERKALEALVFPWIERRIRQEIAAAKADPGVPLIVLDAAIMLETGWGDVCDEIVYIDAPREVRMDRLREQRGWNEAELAAREAAQLPLPDKARRAKATVENAGPHAQLEPQIDRLFARWTARP